MSDDLYKQLVDALYAVPPAERKRSHWVMNREWYDKCTEIAAWPPGPAPEGMLGRPLRVREDAGFPRLVPGVIGTTADADTLERAADILTGLSRKPRSFTVMVLCKTLRIMAARIRP